MLRFIVALLLLGVVFGARRPRPTAAHQAGPAAVPPSPPAARASGAICPLDHVYHDSNEVEHIVDSIAAQYPHIAKRFEIGKSYIKKKKILQRRNCTLLCNKYIAFFYFPGTKIVLWWVWK